MNKFWMSMAYFENFLIFKNLWDENMLKSIFNIKIQNAIFLL